MFYRRLSYNNEEFGECFAATRAVQLREVLRIIEGGGGPGQEELLLACSAQP